MLLKIKNTSIILEDGDRGSNYPSSSELLSNGYCLFLSNKNIYDDKLIIDGSNYITKQKDELLRKGKLQYDDIVMTTRGTIGNFLFINHSFPLPARINSGMVIVRSGNDFIPKYLFYMFQSRFFKEQLFKNQSGSAQPQLPIKDILNLFVSMQSKSIQQHIVDTIGSIDDLIEKKVDIINKLLKLGDLIIEKSSEFKGLSQLCNIGLGGTPSRKHLEFWNGDLDWMNSGEITGNPVVQKSTEKITLAAVDNSSTKLGKIGDTVISIIDPNENKISVLAKPMYYNQSVICLTPYDVFDRGCIFFGIRKAMKNLKTLKNGAAQQSLNKEKFVNASIPYGNKNELYQFIMRIINISNDIEMLNELKQLYLKKFFG